MSGDHGNQFFSSKIAQDDTDSNCCKTAARRADLEAYGGVLLKQFVHDQDNFSKILDCHWCCS